MRRIWGYLGLIFTLASAFLLCASKLMPRLDAARWVNAAETTGQIVGFTETGTNKKPLVCFVATNGEPYVFEAESSSSAMRQGQIVIVRYYLSPDLRAAVKRDFSSSALWLGIAGCVMAAAGLSLLLLQWRKSSLFRQLRLYGARLNAIVTSINRIHPIQGNGHSPFTVTCTLRSPQGIGEMTVTSGWVWKLPPGLQLGSTVPVLVDVNRPGQYCVLVKEAAPAPAPSDTAR